jgi:predicted transposase YbfD/YdcC
MAAAPSGRHRKRFITFPEKQKMAFSLPENLLSPQHAVLQEKAIDVPFCQHPCCSSIRDTDSARERPHGDRGEADISELLEMLARVPEFRREKGREYSLGFVLAACVVATLAGARNYREIATVASMISQHQLRLLGAAWDNFTSCYRSPRRTLIWTVLTHINAAELDRITGTWLLAQARKHKDDEGRIKWAIAIDGKVLRGAWTGENDKVTLFSAMLQEEALTIAQVRVPDGTNEITQVKALASQIGIRHGESVLATLDAAHCNRETASFIGRKQGWDYLITVKTDKPKLYGNAADKIRPALTREPDDIMTERGRGVIKKWSCWTEAASKVDFPHISQIACVYREVFSLTGEKISKDVAIQVTSAAQSELTAADINRHTRMHWGIENKEHYIRDTVYAEDGNQSWKGNGPQALASLRNLATGLFRMKNVKSIREATELVHMNRMMALLYMTTECHYRYAGLPANGPAAGDPGESS